MKTGRFALLIGFVSILATPPVTSAQTKQAKGTVGQSSAMRRTAPLAAGRAGCYDIERIERGRSSGAGFTVSPALGFAEAERCQATTPILQDAMAGIRRPFVF